jgi:hypothetical protein
MRSLALVVSAADTLRSRTPFPAVLSAVRRFGDGDAAHEDELAANPAAEARGTMPIAESDSESEYGASVAREISVGRCLRGTSKPGKTEGLV